MIRHNSDTAIHPAVRSRPSRTLLLSGVPYPRTMAAIGSILPAAAKHRRMFVAAAAHLDIIAVLPLAHWLQLSLTNGLGPVLIRRLVEMAGSAEAACAVTGSDLRRVEGIGQAKSRAIHESLQQCTQDAEQQLERAKELGVRIISWEDDEYPHLLKHIHDPPVVLYVSGTLEPRDLNSIGIVGSRRCSHYGREQAERFASLLAGAGFTVTSGGARGIDSAAHRGAMRHTQGRTIAVLGSGVDVAYPPENAALFKEIAERGAVVSEFPLGTPPNAENFPRRNRVVAGMSRGIFVIEADERSGALITARVAIEDHNRPVFALPGRVDNQMSAGPHKLIREGAVIVTKLEDIIEGLEPLPASAGEPTLFPEEVVEEEKPNPARESVGLSERQQVIIEQLDGEAVTVDQLVERCSLEPAIVLQELTFLRLKGVVKRVDGQTYVRAGKR